MIIKLSITHHHVNDSPCCQSLVPSSFPCSDIFAPSSNPPQKNPPFSPRKNETRSDSDCLQLLCHPHPHLCHLPLFPFFLLTSLPSLTLACKPSPPHSSLSSKVLRFSLSPPYHLKDFHLLHLLHLHHLHPLNCDLNTVDVITAIESSSHDTSSQLDQDQLGRESNSPGGSLHLYHSSGDNGVDHHAGHNM